VRVVVCVFLWLLSPTQTHSLSLHDALPIFLEASWDNYFYTRQWNTPPEVEIIVMPSDRKTPGGAGEAGVAASMAAVACAYARARSEEHTSELQSRENLVCRLLLAKKYRILD